MEAGFAVFPDAGFFADFFAAACFPGFVDIAFPALRALGRFRSAARCAAANAALAQSVSSSGSSYSRSGSCQYEPTVTVLRLVWYWNGFDPSASNRGMV